MAAQCRALPRAAAGITLCLAMPSIDLNADLGELPGADGEQSDAELLTLVSSASIACGFHAGDPRRIRLAVERAAALGVAPGAHPSFLDRAGFGRRELTLPPAQVVAEVAYQVGGCAAVCAAAGTRLLFVKPHGALYNQAARNAALAESVVAGIVAGAPGAALLGPSGSALVAAGREAGLLAAREAFLDRAYRDDGTLVPRAAAGAVLRDPAMAAARAVRIVLEQRVATISGGEIELHADSLCVHGDTPGAAALLRAAREALAAAGISIEPFAS